MTKNLPTKIVGAPVATLAQSINWPETTKGKNPEPIKGSMMNVRKAISVLGLKTEL